MWLTLAVANGLYFSFSVFLVPLVEEFRWSRGLTAGALSLSTVVQGVLAVNGQDLRPARQFFDNFPQQPSTRVGLRSTPFEDLYVVLTGWDGDEATANVSLAVFINPLVSWWRFPGWVSGCS